MCAVCACIAAPPFYVLSSGPVVCNAYYQHEKQLSETGVFMVPHWTDTLYFPLTQFCVRHYDSFGWIFYKYYFWWQGKGAEAAKKKYPRRPSTH